MPESRPRVSVIIPVYNQVELLERCLHSLQRQTERHIEVLVVNDESPEDPGHVLARFPEVRALQMERNGGYAAANNRGLPEARGEYLLFLNSDTELPEEALERMGEYLDTHPDVAGIHPVHRDRDGGLQQMCFRFPTLRLGFVWDSVVHRRWPEHPLIRDFLMADWNGLTERELEHASTSCLLFRREVYERIGGMDTNLRLFYNDTDFCYRLARAGFVLRYFPQVEILHHGGASVGTFTLADAQVYGDRYRYYRKWFGWKGALAVRTALWSRVWYETLTELAHGDLRFAARKLQRGIRLNRALVPTP